MSIAIPVPPRPPISAVEQVRPAAPMSCMPTIAPVFMASRQASRRSFSMKGSPTWTLGRFCSEPSLNSSGRDGLHGATMASEEFQVGDPFMEKLLLEACLEAMKTGAIVGIQDMGAAGLTCSTCEMGARGGVGLDVELDLVPQRETGMTAYEIMLSESQERMLLVAEKGRENEVLRVFAKWGLDAVIVGTVQPEPRLKIRHHGQLMADIPNQSLTDDAPLYHRPIGEWNA